MYIDEERTIKYIYRGRERQNEGVEGEGWRQEEVREGDERG